MRRLAPPAKHRAHRHRPLHIPSLAAGLASLPDNGRRADRDRRRPRAGARARDRRSAREPVAVGRRARPGARRGRHQRRPGARVRQLGDGRLRGARRRHRRRPRRPRLDGGRRVARRPPGGSRARRRRGDRDLDRRDAARRRRRRGPGRGHRRRAASAVEVRVAVEPGSDIRRAGRGHRGRGARAAAGSRARPRRARGARLGRARRGRLRASGPRVAVLTTGDELQEPGRAAAPRRDPQLERATRSPGWSSARAPSCCARRDRPRRPARPPDGGARSGRSPPTLVARLRRRLGRRARPRAPGARGARRRAGLLGRRAAARASRPTSGVARPVRAAGSSSGCPGNPVSAMVTFLLFVAPGDPARCSARPTRAPPGDGDPRRATTRSRRARAPVRCRLELRDDGWHATPTKEQGSHVLTSMLGADALAIVPADVRRPAAGERPRSSSSCSP